jgi:hypothetical protein
MLWSMAQKVVSMEAKLLAVFSSGVPVKVTALCRELGISRQTFYKYRRADRVLTRRASPPSRPPSPLRADEGEPGEVGLRVWPPVAHPDARAG